MIKVKSEVEIREHKDIPPSERENGKFIILSHWNNDELLTIVPPQYAQGNGFTVSKKDILAAIENATNTARF